MAAAAVVLGYFLGGAELGLRTILGTVCVGQRGGDYDDESEERSGGDAGGRDGPSWSSDLSGISPLLASWYDP